MPTPAGGLRKRVAFYEFSIAPDGGGGGAPIWVPYLTVWAQFMPERASERLRNGRMDAQMAGKLTIRSSSEARQIGTPDRVIIDAVFYELTSIANPDQRNQYLELGVQSVAGSVPFAGGFADFSLPQSSQYVALFEDL